MNLAITFHFLQQYWWILASILGALLVFLMFVQGGQTLLHLAKNAEERSLLVNSLGRKWEFTFTTLVTFGGAMFASFPLFYATSFGGAYWVWLAILFCFTIQAISYEFRSKTSNFLGQKTYDSFLFINGSLGVILLGAAVGTFFSGSAFSVNEMNHATWQHPARGLEAALNLNNVSLGLAVFFLARILGAMYFINNINQDEIKLRSVKSVQWNSLFFLIFFLVFLVRLLLADGFAYDPQTKWVSLESFKYLNNFLQMPLVLVLFLLGVILVLAGIALTLFKKGFTKGIWFSGIGTVLTVFSLFLVAGLNNTSFYPSTFDLQSSLTIENASSSFYTLKTMSVVSLLIPFVLLYIYFAWKAIDRRKLTSEDLNKEDHKY